MALGQAIGDALKGAWEAYAWMTGLEEQRKRQEREDAIREEERRAREEDRQFRRDQASRANLYDLREQVGADTPLDENTVEEGRRLGLGGLFDARSGTLGGTDWSGITGLAGQMGGPTLMPFGVVGQAAGTFFRKPPEEQAAEDRATQQRRFRGTLPPHLQSAYDAQQMGFKVSPEDFETPEAKQAREAAAAKVSLADWMKRQQFGTDENIRQWRATTGTHVGGTGAPEDTTRTDLDLYKAEIERQKLMRGDPEINPETNRPIPRPGLKIPSFDEWRRGRSGAPSPAATEQFLTGLQTQVQPNQSPLTRPLPRPAPMTPRTPNPVQPMAARGKVMTRQQAEVMARQTGLPLAQILAEAQRRGYAIQ